MKKHYTPRIDKECCNCFRTIGAYEDLMFRVDNKQSCCYDCYFKKYATDEEKKAEQEAMDSLPF